MAKTGKAAKDIFAPTTKTASTPGKNPVGRPPVHDEAYSKVTVVLFNRQIAFLDRIGADIRQKSGAAVSRAELLRAMVDAVEQSGMDLSGNESEDTIRAVLLERLGED